VYARALSLARAGFANRRKRLCNSLRPVLGVRTHELLRVSGLDPDLRADHIWPWDYAHLAEAQLNISG